MSKIVENLERLRKEVPENVEIVAVSKTKPNQDILDAYNAGQRVFGENKAQDLKQKFQDLPKDIQWHFIGHLQTNKIKYIASFVHLIHGVDSYKLLSAINKEAKKINRTIPCLLQFHVAQEETKFGFDLEEALEMMNSPQFTELNNICIHGVMGMATNTDNTQQVRNEFESLAKIFEQLKLGYFSDNEEFRVVSMGMSGDYKIAIEAGSTMIRVGTSIFGERNY